jgi:hypothetical protein
MIVVRLQAGIASFQDNTADAVSGFRTPRGGGARLVRLLTLPYATSGGYWVGYQFALALHQLKSDEASVPLTTAMIMSEALSTVQA